MKQKYNLHDEYIKQRSPTWSGMVLEQLRHCCHSLMMIMQNFKEGVQLIDWRGEKITLGDARPMKDICSDKEVILQ
ncbi:1660_t:CDS:2 [Paraglomus occultum]|uniref:1660_t:CDS:1 n=1 Tax=Paraglomus occultum TaxID=144539 RepID=A0A9N9F6X8_9GLOM|nr:1660_t:CDS:2 [Paraglomus occultum]